MKKKIIRSLLVLGIILSNINIVFAQDDINNTNNIDMIRSFIYTFDDRIEDVSFSRYLKDIYGNDSFILYQVGDNGYAVTTKETGNIIEVSYDNFPSSNCIYYVGAGDFVDNIINTITLDSNADEMESIKESTDKILSEEPITFQYENSTDNNIATIGRPYRSTPKYVKGGTIVGISDSQMNIFNGKNWINTTKQCGAYAAAVMITYMDKYHGGKYFKESGSYASGNVIDRLKKNITGTSTASQLVYAINTVFLEDYPKGGKHGIVTTSESTYKSKIKSKYPVCLLLLTVKQSGYGDHWVCAYQYIAYNGALWFKVHDNWSGNDHRGWVNPNWIYKGVYTN